MASRTRWTWVWVDSGSWWWTGRPGVLWSMGLQRVRHDWETELNWTEFTQNIYEISEKSWIICIRINCVCYIFSILYLPLINQKKKNDLLRKMVLANFISSTFLHSPSVSLDSRACLRRRVQDGDTCIPVGDSFWYLAKLIQFCKV